MVGFWHNAKRHRKWHRQVAAIAVVALLLRAFVPTGYMFSVDVDTSGAEHLTVVICTGQGSKTVSLDVGTSDGERQPSQGDSPDGSSGSSCPFSLSVHATPLLAGIASDWPFTVLMGRIVIPTPRLLLARVPVGPAVGSRAPPTLS